MKLYLLTLLTLLSFSTLWAESFQVSPSALNTQADDRNAVNLTDFISQRLNTYRAATLPAQVKAAQEYFGATLLSDSEPYFKTKIDNAVKENLTSLFTPDPASVKFTRYGEVPVKYDVVLQGYLKVMTVSTTAELTPIKIEAMMEKTAATPANPYGFRVVVYKESLAANPMPTQLAVPAETGQNPSNTAIGPNKQ